MLGRMVNLVGSRTAAVIRAIKPVAASAVSWKPRAAATGVSANGLPRASALTGRSPWSVISRRNPVLGSRAHSVWLGVGQSWSKLFPINAGTAADPFARTCPLQKTAASTKRYDFAAVYEFIAARADASAAAEPRPRWFASGAPPAELPRRTETPLSGGPAGAGRQSPRPPSAKDLRLSYRIAARDYSTTTPPSLTTTPPPPPPPPRATRRRKFTFVRLGVAVLLSELAWLCWNVRVVHPLAPVEGPAFLQLSVFDFAWLASIDDDEAKKIKETWPPVDAWDPAYWRVVALTRRLLRANRASDSVRGRTWRVTLLENAKPNTYVLSNGHVFVTTGMEKMADDEQLMVAIGHEVAHCLMRDTNGLISLMAMGLLISLTGGCVALAAYGTCAAIAVLLQAIVAWELLVCLPYDRATERRADRLGLLMAAKACVDVASGRRLIKNIQARSKDSDVPWIFKSHPSLASRARHMRELQPEAALYKKLAGCPTR